MTDEATRLALEMMLEAFDAPSCETATANRAIKAARKALRATGPSEPIAQGQREALEQFSSNAPLMVSLRGYLHWRHQGLENSLETAIAKADAALAPSAQGRQYDRSNIHR